MAALSKEEYLKRYLSKDNDNNKKKSKKLKKQKNQTSKIRIFDDDIDVKALIPSNINNTLEDDIGDNDPTIAEFIDERPDQVKQLEVYENAEKWRKVVKQDSSFGNKSDSDSSQKRLVPNKKFRDSDNSSVRRRHDSDSDQSRTKRVRHDSDSDQSSIRKARHDSDSDYSPVRRARHDSDSDQSTVRRKRHDSESDQSPIRRKRHDSNSDQSPVRRKRNHSDSDQSPVRRKRHDSDSDQSPARKRKHDSDSNNSPVKKSHATQSSSRRSRHNSDSGESAGHSSKKSHKLRNDTETNKNSKKYHSHIDSPPPRKRRKGSDSDPSPPRRKNRWTDADPPSQTRGSGSDQSPPRRRKGLNTDISPPRAKRRGTGASPSRFKNSDSDQSPPRRRRHSDSDQSPPRRKQRDSDRRNQVMAKPVVVKEEDEKMKKTLSGAKAGLSTAAEMKRESDLLRKKENEAFGKIDAELLGRDAQTVYRDRKSGKRRNLKEEKELDEEELAKKAVLDEKYKTWGKGLKQKADVEKNVADAVYEMSKPFARYEDDKDLDNLMRNMDREGDPMLEFMKKKKTNANVKEKPKYKGPQPPPNRFGIPPGYRWDGVDRSNGFEKKLFSSLSDKKAVAEMAHKWSVEEM